MRTRAIENLLSAILGLGAPGREERLGNSEDVEHSAGDEVGQVVEGLGLLVEAPCRRDDRAAGLRDCDQVPELYEIERGFARDDDERTALLEHYVGRTLDEIERSSV